MNRKKFENWIGLLKKAWEQRKPKLAIDLVAEEFKYYEEPFEKPITTKETLLKVWQEVPKTQKNISFDYRIIVEKNNLGVAEWEAEYVSIQTNRKSKLNGVFVVKLNEDGKAKEFKQWWNIKEL